MALRPILQDGDPVLRALAEPVSEDLFGSAELSQIVTDMIETLDTQRDGVALAAPQIGISYRIFVVRFDRTLPAPIPPSDEDASETQRETLVVKTAAPLTPIIGVFINPEFVRSSRKRVEMDEGCLSVRGIYGTTLRHERATIRARAVDGSRFERGGGGLVAQIFQHEIDHLNGILFTDHAIEYTEVRKEVPETDAALTDPTHAD
jgi:peptide deformylase